MTSCYLIMQPADEDLVNSLVVPVVFLCVRWLVMSGSASMCLTQWPGLWGRPLTQSGWGSP